jgi:hypothetical protein
MYVFCTQVFSYCYLLFDLGSLLYHINFLQRLNFLPNSNFLTGYGINYVWKPRSVQSRQSMAAVIIIIARSASARPRDRASEPEIMWSPNQKAHASIHTNHHGSGQLTQVSLHCMLYVGFASKNKGI